MRALSVSFIKNLKNLNESFISLSDILQKYFRRRIKDKQTNTNYDERGDKIQKYGVSEMIFEDLASI